MKEVHVLCTDPTHPVNSWLESWADRVAGQAKVHILRDVSALRSGDFLFLVSCQQIVRKAMRAAYRHCLVLHASALPEGRGMSPHIWQLLQGRDHLTVTLLNAEDMVDSGAIWHQLSFPVARTALADEINRDLFESELALMDWAIEHCDKTQPYAQKGPSTSYRRRTPADSEIDVNRPLSDYFDLLRVADPMRFPAYFVHRGQKYRVRIDKL